MALKIKLNNLDVVLSNLRGINEKARGVIQKELDSFGLNTVNDAKRFAPVDEGTLRGKIFYKKEKLKVTVTVGVNYGALLEFGTRKFAAAYVASLPPDWQTFAATFKGPGGGSFEEMVMRLTEWVHRKGLGSGKSGKPIGVTGTYSVKTGRRTGGKAKQADENKAAAYAIARAIMIKGIRPHPYLFPAYEKNRIILINNLKAALT